MKCCKCRYQPINYEHLCLQRDHIISYGIWSYGRIARRLVYQLLVRREKLYELARLHLILPKFHDISQLYYQCSLLVSQSFVQVTQLVSFRSKLASRLLNQCSMLASQCKQLGDFGRAIEILPTDGTCAISKKADSISSTSSFQGQDHRSYRRSALQPYEHK
jgi:hypothetical protein